MILMIKKSLEQSEKEIEKLHEYLPLSREPIKI